MKIKQTLDTMRQRPGMYIEDKRIDYIFYLLDGYCVGWKKAVKDGQKVDDDDEMSGNFTVWFGQWLKMWIEDNIDPEFRVSVQWYKNIKAITKDGQDEFDVFFELCDKFFDDYKNRRGYFSDLE